LPNFREHLEQVLVVESRAFRKWEYWQQEQDEMKDHAHHLLQ
jgi:hypothetical protein